MAIQDDSTVLCKGDLKAYHESILPYLGGNMALSTNISDYYSTDEKIVGVWIDGKPLYQIVLAGNVPSSDSVAWTTNELINVKSMGGVVDRSDGGQMPIPFAYPGVSQDIVVYFHKHGAVTDMHLFGKSNLDQGRPYELIVQYTKDSDAVNSAVTTPGCYDINFPNTWPENTEVYFGNGLYGRRFTGTAATTTTIKDIDLLSGLPTTTTIVKSGGILKRHVMGTSYYDFTIPFVYESLMSGTIAFDAGVMKFIVKNSGVADVPYDIWVCYTK